MPLHIAAFHRHKAACDVLIAAGADMEANDNKSGWAPLHFAAYNGCADVCRALLTVGADVAAKSSSGGSTPLHIAAENGHTETCEVLLAPEDSDKDARDNSGRTAEECAISNGKTHLSGLFSQLAAHGAAGSALGDELGGVDELGELDGAARARPKGGMACSGRLIGLIIGFLL